MLGLLDADARVGDRNPNAIGGVEGFQAHGTAGGRELEGVGEQVADDGVDLFDVGAEGNQIGIAIDLQADVTLFGQRRGGGDHFADQRVNVEPAHFELHVPGFELREVEQPVDQFQKPLAVDPHGRQHGGDRLGQGGFVPVQDPLDRSQDHRQRSSQFVAEIREEVGLQPVILLQLREGALQRPFALG